MNKVFSCYRPHDKSNQNPQAHQSVEHHSLNSSSSVDDTEQRAIVSHGLTQDQNK